MDETDFNALDHWARKICPFIKNMHRAKQACLLTLASGNVEGASRNRIHTLLVGPPGTGKTRIRNWIKHELGAYGAGPKSSEAGLKYDARGEGTPGLLAQAHREVLVLDELEKFNSKDRDALLEAMEEGEYEVVTGGSKKTVPAEVRVVACCNSTEGLEAPLLDRFDFVVETDVLSKARERRITDHIYDMWFSDGGDSGGRLLGFLRWVETRQPSVGGETMEKIKKIKNDYIAKEGGEPDIRGKESLLRIAIAIARLNDRDVRVEDYLEAIRLREGEGEDQERLK